MIDDVAKAVSTLWERWEAYRTLRGEQDSLRHLLSLEIRRNLALLDALKLDGDQDNDALRSIAGELETDVLEQVFAPTKAARSVRETLDEVDPDADEEATAKSVLMNLYVRIIAVQKLARLPKELEGLRDIQYRTRLQNVRRTLRSLLVRIEPRG